MIEAAEFAAKWQHEHHLDKVDDSLVKLEPQAVEDINLPADAKRFLIDAGLPRSAAPFLTFDDVAQGLRRIWETWGIPDDWGADDRKRLSRYFVIGSDSSGNPICIDALDGGQVVLLDHDDSFSTRQFVNSGIPQLAEFLLIYREMIVRTQTESGEAFLEGNIPEALRQHTIWEFERIDADALKEGSFWWYEVVSNAAI
jgi:hypothetical protein